MKEFSLAIGIGANIRPGFGTTISTVNKGISTLNQNINKINNQRAMIESIAKMEGNFNKLNGEITANNDKMKTLASTGTMYGQEINKLQAVTNKYKSELESLNTKEGVNKDRKKQLKDAIVANNQEMKKLQEQAKGNTTEYKRLEAATNRLVDEKSREENKYRSVIDGLKQQGIDMRALGTEYDKLTQKAQRYQKAANLSAKGDAWKNRAQTMGRVGTRLGITGGAIGAALYKPAQMAIDEEANWSEVKKLADFKSKEEESRYKERLQALIKEKRMAISLEELYTAAGAGLQAGLTQQETLDYVEQATKMGVAFDMNRDQTARYLYAWKNAFGLNIEQIKELSDQINALGDNTGATESQIATYLTRLGNAPTIANFAPKQTATLGASLIETGMDPEIAATASKKMFNVLANGTKGLSKKQLEVLNSVGISAKKLTELTKKNSDEAMDYLFGKLAKVEDKAGVFTVLFGELGKIGSANILQGYDKYIENRKLVNDENIYKDGVEKQYNIRNDTLSNDLLIAQQQFKLAMVDLGTGLMPLIKDTTKSAVELIKKFSEWAKNNPEKVKKYTELLAKLAVGLLGASIAAKGLSGAFHLVSAGFKVSSWITKVGGIGAAFSKVGLVLKGAFLNPVTLAIAGIAALIFAGYKLYKNWDTVKAKAAELAPKISELIDKYWWVLGPIGAIIKGGKDIYQNWDTIKEKASQLKEAIVEMVINWIGKWEEFKTITSATLGSVFDWINEKWESVKSVGTSVIDFLIEAHDKITTLFGSTGKSISEVGNYSELNWGTGNNIPGFADGGIVRNPTLAMVGEGGSAEAIIPLNNKKESLSLWQRAGEYIGGFKNTGSGDSNFNDNVTFTYQDNRTIYANDSTGVKEILDKDSGMSQERFNKMMANYEREKRRKSFDR